MHGQLAPDDYVEYLFPSTGSLDDQSRVVIAACPSRALLLGSIDAEAERFAAAIGDPPISQRRGVVSAHGGVAVGRGEPVSTPKREQPRSTVEIAQAWTDRGERSMPVVAEYCDALMTLVNEVHDPVGSITHDVRAMAEMPTIEFLRSDELEIEQMSA